MFSSVSLYPWVLHLEIVTFNRVGAGTCPASPVGGPPSGHLSVHPADTLPLPGVLEGGHPVLGGGVAAVGRARLTRLLLLIPDFR